MLTKLLSYNTLVILGATATGKTSLAVKMARHFNGEIISADSRQVYRGLDIGSGKDLSEYGAIPYHLIDICDLETEYTVFHFQKDAYRAWNTIRSHGSLPIIAGGTGLYLDALLRKYELVSVPENSALRAELADKNIAELQARFFAVKKEMHNKTDLEKRDRLLRAIEIAEYMHLHPEAAVQTHTERPDIRPLVLGIFFERAELRARIKARLEARLESGMVEEVAALHHQGASWERLESLGLEYRFTALLLQGKLMREDYEKQLFQAIGQFAKRQETWFRRMEKNGVSILKIPNGDFDYACKKVGEYF